MTPVTGAELDIMALVECVKQTRQTYEIAREAERAASEALRVAIQVSRAASDDFDKAQNALVVAAGGDDKRLSWFLLPTVVKDV